MGASSYFIDPKFVSPQHRDPLSTKAINENGLKRNTDQDYPAFSEFNWNDTFVFFLLNFHNYFDGLIGVVFLSV